MTGREDAAGPPRRILHVVDKLAIGGSTIHGATTCIAVWVPRYDPTRFDVRVCNLRGRDRGVEYLERLGIPVVPVERGRFDPRTLRDLVRIVRQQGIDLLHLHGYGATNFGRLAGRLVGVPSIVHEHFADLRMPAYQRAADRALRPLTVWAIAVSEAVRGFMLRDRAIPAERLEVVYNGAALETFDGFPARGSPAWRALRERLRLPVARPVIAIVARLTPIKGHTYFLQAAARVVRQVPDVTFLVVGDGELDATLRAEARHLGLEGQVVFTGYRGDVPALLAASDALAITSIHEGAPLSLLEAMAAGCGIVATHVGGIGEVLEDGVSGLLVHPQDPDAIAGGLLRLIGDPSLRTRLGSAAQSAVAARFDVRTTVRRLEDRYTALLRRDPTLSPSP